MLNKASKRSLECIYSYADAIDHVHCIVLISVWSCMYELQSILVKSKRKNTYVFYYVYKHTDVPSSFIIFFTVWYKADSLFLPPACPSSLDFTTILCFYLWTTGAHCNVHVATLKSAVSWDF